DLAKSVEFYSELFGWTVQEEGGDNDGLAYRRIASGDHEIGGFIELDAEGVPSHWIGYVTVDDVDSACGRARKLGGKTPVPGTDIPNVGRFAVVSHPGGSYVSPFAPHELEITVPEAETIPGRFCWNQLMSKDPDAAAEYYQGVFGWTVTEQDLGGGKYWLFRSGDAPAAGMMSINPQEKYPDFWMPYVEVHDVNETCKEVAELGGQIMVEPSDVPDLARIAVTADPTGAILGISTHRGR
ncbi:MAG: VOC family protein, partial [Gemmatimonadetes bacterium]|nr:VOC family protein [Gemmatimonadota bacterium]